MEFRQFGDSGLQVPVLSYGTGTFGGHNDFFKTWGSSNAQEATRLVDVCLNAGVNFFDTANSYSDGHSELILGAAIKGRRDRVLLSTKASIPVGPGPNDRGSSRHHIVKAVEDSLKRLGTDYLDVYFMHIFDALTPIDETLRALDNLVQSGKIRYFGCSNYSGWHLMKALATSEKFGLNRFVVHQAYYSLIGRDYEWELMPLAIDQKIGTMVWSPLGWGRLTGKMRRGQTAAAGRIQAGGSLGGPEILDEDLFKVVDALDLVAQQTGRSVSQIALNWLLTRPTVCNIVMGARTEQQLLENLGAVQFQLSTEQISQLDKASQRTPIYPYWHQRGFEDRNPKPTSWS